MIALQLFVNGIITGLGLGVVAISFSLVYSTTGIFHVAHAGIYVLAGYFTWSLMTHGLPLLPAFLIAVVLCAVGGTLIQSQLYERLVQRRATPLVILIASIGLLAVIQNVVAMIYTANILQFPVSWRLEMFEIGAIRLSYPQLLMVGAGPLCYVGLLAFTRYTTLGKQIRAVANNPFLADITRLRPRRVYAYVLATASAMVAVAGLLIPLDFGLQPYSGLSMLLTGTVAMIAGGIGSTSGAFLIAMTIAILQNLAILVMPGEWGVGITFFIFVLFMLFRPTGLFREG